MLKKICKIFMLLLTFLFLISAFFYFHHQRPAWNAEIPGWQDYQRQGIQIKEIWIFDWQERDYYLTISEMEERHRKITWLTQWLPESSQQSFYNFISRSMYFYSLHYEKTEGLRIHLIGVAEKEFEHEALSLSHNNRPSIYINGNKAYFGSRMVEDDEDKESGIIYFLLEVEGSSEIDINEIRDIDVEFKKADSSVFNQNIKIDKLDKEVLAPFERYPERYYYLQKPANRPPS